LQQLDNHIKVKRVFDLVGFAKHSSKIKQMTQYDKNESDKFGKA
jgi:hypothetical protein